MKVYSLFIEDDGFLFRTKSLLQFGESWDLIGSIIMKNPGGAKPTSFINEETQLNLKKFYNKDLNFSKWSCTDADNTMINVSSIFNGHYVNRNKELNGIIQIFNLSNICETSVDKAHSNGNITTSKYLLPNIEETIIEFNNKPVYIGFGDFYTNKKSKNFDSIKNYAQKIFEYVKNSDKDYLQDDFLINNHFYHKNHFYHPQYLRIAKPHIIEKYQPTLEKFYKLYEY